MLVPDFGPRYVAGRRVHHGLVGVVLLLVGAWLALDDAKDFPWKPNRRRTP